MKFYKKSKELDFRKMFGEIRKDEINEFIEKCNAKNWKPGELERFAHLSILIEYLATKYEEDLDFQERCQNKGMQAYNEASDEEREYERKKHQIKVEYIRDKVSIEQLAKKHNLPALVVRECLNDSFMLSVMDLPPEDGKPVTEVKVYGNAGFMQTAIVEEGLKEIVLEYEKLHSKEDEEEKENLGEK